MDQGLGGGSDAELAALCLREARALVTLDLDFADIRAYPPAAYRGLVVLRLVRQDKRHVLDVLARLVQALRVEPLDGTLWIVEENRIRIRE